MSDKPTTHSWQIETKNGVSTRVEEVAIVRIEGDALKLAGTDEAPLFLAPFSSLAYAKRVEPRGMNTADGVQVTVPEGIDPEALGRQMSREAQWRAGRA